MILITHEVDSITSVMDSTFNINHKLFLHKQHYAN